MKNFQECFREAVISQYGCSRSLSFLHFFKLTSFGNTFLHLKKTSHQLRTVTVVAFIVTRLRHAVSVVNTSHYLVRLYSLR